MRLKYLAPLIGFVLLASVLGVGLTLNPRDLPSTLIDKPAPLFTLERLYQPGNYVSPTDFAGKRWLLNVWASWCVACRVEHPLLNELAQTTNIPMVGLNYKDDPRQATKWLADRGNPYGIVAKDINGDTGIDWGVYGVPETFVIDESGIVIFKHTGPIDVIILRNQIMPLFEAG